MKNNKSLMCFVGSVVILGIAYEGGFDFIYPGIKAFLQANGIPNGYCLCVFLCVTFAFLVMVKHYKEELMTVNTDYGRLMQKYSQLNIENKGLKQEVEYLM